MTFTSISTAANLPLRESPWGPLFVADAHVHFFSRRFFELLAAQRPGLTAEAAIQQIALQAPPERPEELADTWVAELNRHGVAVAALIASVPGDESSVVAARK